MLTNQHIKEWDSYKETVKGFNVVGAKKIAEFIHIQEHPIDEPGYQSIVLRC
jgi:hypothetical protein